MKVLIKTVNFGTIETTSEWDDGVSIYVKELQARFQTKYLLEYDERKLIVLNSTETESHQVEIKYIDRIEIDEGIEPSMRIIYVVKTPTGERFLYGTKSTLKLSSVQKMWFAFNTMPHNMFVTW